MELTRPQAEAMKCARNLHLKRVILMARWRGYARRMKKYRIEL
jgi:hypothetical protein